jgi:hypothetical protein
MKVTLPAAVVLVLSIWLLCAGCKNSTGQSIWVFKELDLVVVFTAGYFGRSVPDMEWLTQYVLPTFM